MYAQYQGGGRPESGSTGRPLSSGEPTIPVTEIVNFARDEAASVWSAFGLGAIVLPTISYGKTRGNMHAETTIYPAGTADITLNKKLIGKWVVAQFAQALLMELGNYVNRDDLKKVTYHPDNYSSADAYAMAIEKIEYRSVEVISKEISKPESKLKPPIWSTVPKDFDEFYNLDGIKKHRAYYEDEWHVATGK